MYYYIDSDVLNGVEYTYSIVSYDMGISDTTQTFLIENENADPSVRVDLDLSFDHLVRENEPYYTHIFEGPDDMPAHIKSSLVGSSVTIPISNGRLNLGIWQGIYLCEFRNRGGARKVVISIYS